MQTPALYFKGFHQLDAEHPTAGWYFDGLDDAPRGPFHIKAQAQIAADEHLENFAGAGA
ncbi:MAG: hypothetical protein Q8Q73_19150 [Stagnimonas sp.]|nr:hypothetical protein [Stagnimonas sp.]